MSRVPSKCEWGFRLWYGQTWRRWCRVEFAIIEVFMKRTLSRMLVASGVLMGTCATSVSHSAEANAMPDPVAGEQLDVSGDTSRGLMSCARGHGEAGNTVGPSNPCPAGQPYPLT